MKENRISNRVVQIFAGISCSLPPLFIAMGLPPIASAYKRFYADMFQGKPLPQVTLTVLGLSDMLLARYGPGIGILLAGLCLTTVLLIINLSPTEESRSTRALGFTTLVWCIGFGTLSVILFALAAPAFKWAQH